jgi:hypothetical protein
MMRPKSVKTDRVWLRDDFTDPLDRIDEELRLNAFMNSTPNGSAIAEYLRHERKERKESMSHEPEYRFFYDASSQKADYLALWAGMEKYPTVIRHTVEKVTPDEARTIDELTSSVSRCSPAQFGWAIAELEIASQSNLDSAE